MGIVPIVLPHLTEHIFEPALSLGRIVEPILIEQWRDLGVYDFPIPLVTKRRIIAIRDEEAVSYAEARTKVG